MSPLATSTGVAPPSLSPVGVRGYEVSFMTTSITLFGNASVVGRSFVIKPTGRQRSEWLCGTIGDGVPQTYALASLGTVRVPGSQMPLSGTIVFRQSMYDVNAPTTLEVRLR